MGAEGDELGDLAMFLSDARPQMRAAAAEMVQGLSGSDEGVAQLAERSADMVPPLLRLLGKPLAEARCAATALVNLTADARAAEAALEKGAVERAMEHVRDPERAELRGLMVMLLANLTVSPAGAALMLQQGKGVLEGFHFSYLLHLLAAEPGGWAAHAAHVAANVSNLPAGRALLVAPTDGRVALLARALAAPGAAAAARWGSATALRNCALDEELHGALLAPVGYSASPVVPALLAPLAPAARVAEQAVPLREACADALAALARTEAGRAAMWAAGAVESMRVAYEDEQAPRVCAALEQAAELLITRGKAEAEQEAGAEQKEAASVEGRGAAGWAM